MSERHRQIEELFHAALKLEPSRRDSFLSDACGSDPTLRSEIEALISAHEQPGTFLNFPAVEVGGELIMETRGDMLTGGRIAHYAVRDFIGRGGMGEVYRAHDSRLGRDVAVKILPQEESGNSDSQARLLREARAAASLNHPNICTVHEVGQSDGRAYIAMELIEGQPLSALISKGPLSPAELHPLFVEAVK